MQALLRYPPTSGNRKLFMKNITGALGLFFLFLSPIKAKEEEVPFKYKIIDVSPRHKKSPTLPRSPLSMEHPNTVATAVSSEVPENLILDLLPDELLVRILSFLSKAGDSRSILQTSMTCRRLFAISRDWELWKDYVFDYTDSAGVYRKMESLMNSGIQVRTLRLPVLRFQEPIPFLAQHLEHIEARNCTFQYSDLLAIANAPKLKKAGLSGVSMTPSLLKQFLEKPSLKVLKLNDLNIPAEETSQAIRETAKPAPLVRLDLDRSGLTHIDPLSRFENLKTLSIFQNPVADLHNLAKFTGLNKLVLGKQLVSDEIIESICSISGLRYLSLYACNVTTPHLRRIKEKLPLLEVLQVGKTFIDNQGIRVIASMPNLRELCIAKCLYVNQEGYLHLKSMRPDIEIWTQN